MPVSLEMLSRKIGDKRRELKTVSEDFQSKVKSYEAAGDALTAFDEANTGELSDELKADRGKLDSAVRDARGAMMSAGDHAGALKSELVELESDLTVYQSSNALDDFLASRHGPVGGDGERLPLVSRQPGGASDNIRVLPPDRPAMEHHLGVYLQSQMLAQIDRCNAADVARNYFKNDYVASAMSVHDHSRGGSFVQGAFADFYITLLRDQAVLRSVGVPTVPIEGGSMTIPKLTQGVIGGYRGEEQDIEVEELGTGDITLTPKELSTLVPTTEKLVRQASTSAAAMIREDMLAAGALLEDSKFLRGSPSGAGPTGLRHRAAAANIKDYNGSVTASGVEAFIASLELALLESSVWMRNPWWITSHRVISFLSTLRNSDGHLVYPEIKDGKLKGYPFKATNQIPVNLATPVNGSNGSPTVGYTELMFLDVAAQVIGEVPGIRFDVSNEASYTVNGTVVNAFQRGQVLFRLQMENDIHTRYEESIAVGVDIEWL